MNEMTHIKNVKCPSCTIPLTIHTDEYISVKKVKEAIEKLTVGKGLPYDHEFEGCIVADDLLKELGLDEEVK